MKNTYKTSINYFNTHNRNLPYNLKSYGKLKTEPAYYNKDMPKSINYLSLNEGFDNILSKALSKKKKRGILDISSQYSLCHICIIFFLNRHNIILHQNHISLYNHTHIASVSKNYS